MFLPSTRKYKIPLLLSLAVFFVYVALRVEANWMAATFALLGSVLAVFLLDIEYIAFSYLIEPSYEKSVQLKNLIQAKQYKNAFRYVTDWESQSQDEEMTIRSAMFQALMYLFTFYFISTQANGFVVCFSLSMLANLLYLQVIEFARTKTLKRWFWIYSGELNRDGYIAYIIVATLLLIGFCFFI